MLFQQFIMQALSIKTITRINFARLLTLATDS